MIDKTLIYLTDNRLNDEVYKTCRHWLIKNSMGMPIVSVSQEPIDLGKNICVGEIGRSGMCIDIQLAEGLKHVKTTYVQVSEHDCLYSTEHMEWIPPDDGFWYNDNNWLLQWYNPIHMDWNGMFSYMARRRVQSQLICKTDRLREAMTLKLEITAHPDWHELYPSGRVAEPGCSSRDRTIRLAKRAKVRHLMPKVLKYLDAYEASDFRTKLPNVDIRHGGNFTGQRRGNKRRYSLNPWGTMDDIIRG